LIIFAHQLLTVSDCVSQLFPSFPAFFFVFFVCPDQEEQLMEDTVEDIPQGDASRRFAVMGCDWDHVFAGDLLVPRHGFWAARLPPLLGPVVLKPLLVDDRGVMLSNNELELGMIIMGLNQPVERNGQRVLNSSLNSLSLIVGNLIITMDFRGTHGYPIFRQTNFE
jgi:hypothetical protein